MVILIIYGKKKLVANLYVLITVNLLVIRKNKETKLGRGGDVQLDTISINEGTYYYTTQYLL